MTAPDLAVKRVLDAIAAERHERQCACSPYPVSCLFGDVESYQDLGYGEEALETALRMGWTPPTAQEPRPLQVGDRVHVGDGYGGGQTGLVIEAPAQMYRDDPGPRVRVQITETVTRDVTPLCAHVEHLPEESSVAGGGV